MSSLDDLPNLKDMLESLLLPEERSEIAGSARYISPISPQRVYSYTLAHLNSTAKREALSKAGITTVMDLIEPQNKKLFAELKHPTSFARDIIKRIERLKNNEFRACQLNTQLKVPAELQVRFLNLIRSEY